MPIDGDEPPTSRSSDERTLKLRDDDLAARSFADETVVLDLRTSKYMSTNATGSVLWSALTQGATRTELVTALVNEFDVDRERATVDVEAFLDDCRQRDLIDD